MKKSAFYTMIACSDTEIEFSKQWLLFQTIYNSTTVLGVHLLKCDLGQDLQSQCKVK